jgi:hypothetical protein
MNSTLGHAARPRFCIFLLSVAWHAPAISAESLPGRVSGELEQGLVGHWPLAATQEPCAEQPDRTTLSLKAGEAVDVPLSFALAACLVV